MRPIDQYAVTETCSACKLSKKVKIIDTRVQGEDKRRIRTRECLGCGEIFQTVEVLLSEFGAIKNRQSTIKKIETCLSKLK